MKRIAILGGGVSGLLAAFRARQAGMMPTVFEAGPPRELTRAWGTNYLWQPLPDFECREFFVRTTIDGKEPDFEGIYRYKTKVGKQVDGGDWGMQFMPASKGYDILNWPNLEGIDIRYNREVIFARRTLGDTFVVREHGEIFTEKFDLMLSTIPMPFLIPLMGVDLLLSVDATFKSTPIHVKRYQSLTKMEGMLVNYISDPTLPEYRRCIRDGTIHIESLVPFPVEDADVQTHCIRPGKIYETPDSNHWSDLICKQIPCFGRFARWKSDELVHETDAALRDWMKVNA